MCWCFSFGLSSKKKRQSSSSSGEKKRRDVPDEPLHGKGKTVVAEVSEKRRSSETHRKRRTGESTSPRSSRREKEEHRPRTQQYRDDTYPSRDSYRPSLNVQVPDMWHRSVEPGSTNSSQEALLNPRPHRSTHQRQRHPKRTSQTTLRGRGAKRDPPRHSKSKKNLRPEPSRGWSLFAPSPPKTPKREHRNYQTLDSSPRSHRSLRQHRSPQTPSDSPTPRSQNRRRSSRQHERDASPSRQARSRTPNTTARRVPDRRFAVLAATNQALENVRREAFAQPSPPPRRDRLRRYEGVAIPANQIPFSWDCVSSSQTSAGYGTTSGEPSSRPRRSRR
ncbi:hypothetical protein HBI56_002080 [Parastagonospora nodorum]|nr:hypothetical protein HBH53_094150 [Parastagonospora nodorum]KAH3972597.1 hypothetical protein HBH52_151110 [Parastagonospora nodorum]KAH4005394.1 hypothetical protein HBI10_036680 [Parastagonospora nodorum]KAH4032822.1 hypothetical protein HBI13_002490 [Parastagonospora nodorum]KAH4061202.1 hypothetical protein HBH49_012110 [Parastagonospora nodorum]